MFDDAITKNLARGLVRTIGIEKIGKMSEGLISDVIKAKKEIPLSEGEDDVIGIVYEMNGVSYFAQAVIHENADGKTEILRYIDVKEITKIVQSLISNI